MKKDFVKGIAVGCALSMAIGGASALADTYRKFLEVAYTDIKVVVNGKPTTPRDSDGTPVKPFISSGTTYLPVNPFQTLWDKTLIGTVTQALYISAIN